MNYIRSSPQATPNVTLGSRERSIMTRAELKERLQEITRQLDELIPVASLGNFSSHEIRGMTRGTGFIRSVIRCITEHPEILLRSSNREHGDSEVSHD